MAGLYRQGVGYASCHQEQKIRLWEGLVLQVFQVKPYFLSEFTIELNLIFGFFRGSTSLSYKNKDYARR